MMAHLVRVDWAQLLVKHLDSLKQTVPISPKSRFFYDANTVVRQRMSRRRLAESNLHFSVPDRLHTPAGAVVAGPNKAVAGVGY